MPPPSAPIAVTIAGAAGRMGTRLVALVRESSDLRLAAALEAPRHPSVGRDAGEVAGVGAAGVVITDDVAAAIGAGRVLVEFSAPDPSLEHLRSVAAAGGHA